ncbi:response regulator transcription factor [Arsenicicoccus piscis]|uniref:DNA-binding response regulator n=1 Tax=Arsenicicoccus piscis TaxID=673954 RepID=A0ABQ6HMA8_9MICO|nr:response regulator transcription factor [Arsenicicoccus piscis]MCH8628360.1 response regulator transcription factor [Arsenicicoccus piscis]GMA18634.1 DNA-binding response regulator [Arsenicicoccus piscis]
MTISVVVADDDALVRSGLAAILGAEPDLVVVGEAADGVDAVRVTRQQRPDVVLMDVRMPGTDGIESTKTLRAQPDPPKIVVITTFEHDAYVYEALLAGANAFVLKRATPEELVAVVRTVASTDALVFPEAIRALAAGRAGSGRVAAWGGRLTEREHEVLRLVARGHTNAEVAASLYLGVETVKTHVSALLAKSGARDRTALVVAAYEGRVIEPSRPH